VLGEDWDIMLNAGVETVMKHVDDKKTPAYLDFSGTASFTAFAWSSTIRHVEVLVYTRNMI
jgi:hypothetical protein